MQEPKKTLYIMRGVPGAGKSTRAKKLTGPTGFTVGADDWPGYGDTPESYRQTWDKAIEAGTVGPMLHKAHSWTLDQVEQAMKKGVKGQALDVFLNMIDSDSKKIVEFDGDYNVNMEDVKTVVDSTMGRYGEVFSHKINIADGTPNRQSRQYEKKVDVSKMSAAEHRQWVIDNASKLGF